MRAHTSSTGDGRTHVWLSHGAPLAVHLTTTTPEHAARITAAVNASSPAGRPVLGAIAEPGRLDRRLAARQRCTCHTAPGMTEGPAADCPRHGDPAVLGYTPEAQRRD